jgi:hypothetical protein
MEMVMCAISERKETPLSVEQRMSPRQPARILLLVALVIVFAAMAAYSAFGIRYTAGAKKLGEPAVTMLSLTDDIHRGRDGRLALAAGAESGTPKKGKACPT